MHYTKYMCHKLKTIKEKNKRKREIVSFLGFGGWSVISVPFFGLSKLINMRLLDSKEFNTLLTLNA